jgi:hypothetical protein
MIEISRVRTPPLCLYILVPVSKKESVAARQDSINHYFFVPCEAFSIL